MKYKIKCKECKKIKGTAFYNQTRLCKFCFSKLKNGNKLKCINVKIKKINAHYGKNVAHYGKFGC